MLRQTLVAVVAVIALDGELARADTRGTLRVGVMPLELVSSSDTPLFGDGVDRVVDKYNSVAAAYDRMSGATTERLDAADLGVEKNLLVFAPGLELGSGGAYFFRLEGLVGIADEMKSIGVGMYPINVQVTIRRSVAIYASAGGSASWLDREGTGDMGGLVAARAAAGLRLARHFVIEVGYNAFVLGGSVNSERLADMADGNVMAGVQPADVISAGEARGIVDASLGFAF